MKHNASRRADELRPISLLCIVSKMYDSLMLQRLQRISDNNKWIPEYQAGFRKHRSAIEHLIRLQQEGHTAFSEGKVLVVAFLDISKAYDCVNRSLLISKLKALGIGGKMMQYLSAFLGKRYAWVTYKKTDSDVREFNHGVPQGSPISPFLFNVYCAAALEGCGEGIGMQADDMCVWRTHMQENVACEALTKDLSTVFSWGESHNMRFSFKKCKVLRITSRKPKSLEKYPIVLFGGQVMEVVESHKYLGVTIDRSLTWKHHINATVEKAKKRLRSILRLCSSRRGVGQRMLIMLYVACLRPVLEYASEVWGDVSRTNARKLTTVQHHAIKSSLGVNRRAHTADVCVEAQIPPLEVRREIQLLRTWKNMHLFPRPLTKFLAEIRPQQRLRSKQRNSFLERAAQLMEELKFSHEKIMKLKKDQYRKIEHNLWRLHRSQSVRDDQRSVDYDLFQPKIKMKLPLDYTKTRRRTVAEWHGLRLGTLPLNEFLHSIARHEDGQCVCKTGQETVEHFLLNCPIHAGESTTLVMEIQDKYHSKDTPSIARMLSTDNRSFNSISSFLESINRFDPP